MIFVLFNKFTYIYADIRIKDNVDGFFSKDGVQSIHYPIFLNVYKKILIRILNP
jgi:hypothetical protein